jgi:hypothetical protein
MLNIRSWPLKRGGGGTHFRFDFSISDMSRRGVVAEGVTVSLVIRPEYNADGELTETVEASARRQAETLLRAALAELRRAPG